jgi:hypothetical protein
LGGRIRCAARAKNPSKTVPGFLCTHSVIGAASLSL